MTQRVVATLGRLRWPIVGLWLVLLAVAGVVGGSLPSVLSGAGWNVPGSESDTVNLALRHGFVARGDSTITVVVHDQWYSSSQPGFEKRAGRVIDELAARKELAVTSRLGFASTSGDVRRGFVAPDGSTSIELLGLGIDEGTAGRVLPNLQHDVSVKYAAEGLDVALVGATPFWGEVTALGDPGVTHAEMVAVPLILFVLVAVYGGLVAALVSLSVGVTSIVGSFAVLTLVARQTELSPSAEITATILGLVVGVAYSLFVISRFREELARGRAVDEALAVTLKTSGETVLFSGITIVAAMSTLFLVPLGVITSIALGAVVVVAFSIITSVLLLPVLLRIVGPRINTGRIPLSRKRSRDGARWAFIVDQVMNYPLVFLGAALVLMVGIAVPANGLTTFPPDASVVPTSPPVPQGFDRIPAELGAGSTSPITVLVTSAAPLDTPQVSAAVVALEQRLSHLPFVNRVDSALPALKGVSPAAPLAALQPSVRSQLPDDVAALVGHYVSDDGRRLVLAVVATGRASDESTRDLLEATHEVVGGAGIPGASVHVGGETAEGVASNTVITDNLPRVFGGLLAVTYLMLLFRFRSVLLPLKAVLVNLLSAGATLGILVLVFPPYITSFIPTLLLASLFSLGTGYEVFVLGRVREELVKIGDHTQSVARGVARTAPVISGAALLLVVVFGGLGFAGSLPMKQLGFGMAVAIALDAILVRLVIGPASMRLLGRWSWWLPGRGSPGPAPAAATMALTAADLSAEWVLEGVDLQPAETRR